jgi:lysophospholipase L1-like esterase
MQRLSPERLIGIGLGIGAIALAAVLIFTFGAAALGGGSGATPTQAAASQPSATATATSAATPEPSATAGITPWATPTPTPTPAPTVALHLPTMLAAIGDSYSQGWSVSSAYKHDHPQFSWVVGYAKRDGVYSLRERFEALGDKLTVADAATSAKKMSDAGRQARAVAAAAANLPAGSTVYVTFELGINDLCDNPMTDLATFEAQLRAATTTLEAGLPAGSRILMLSVPDFRHFYAITQANAAARYALSLRINSQNCAPFLGSSTPYTMAQADSMLAAYNSILYRVCDEIEATDGPSDRLHCTHNEALLSERDFTIRDMSTVDYFHPSITGQARMAAAAWKAGYWAGVPLPAGAAAFAPSGSGELPLAGLFPIAPLVPPAVRRRLTRPRRRPVRP